MRKQHEHQPHARFFESVFSNLSMAKKYLRNFLPKEIVKKLSLKDLKLEKDTFITDELKRWSSDIIYSCPFGKNKTPVKLTFLLDHKSTPDKFVNLQLLRYMTAIWAKQQENQEPLTPIIPIIFYHGEKDWVYLSFEDLFPKFDDDLRPFLPEFNYHLTDLRNYTDEELFTMKLGFLLNSLLAFKHYKNQNYIEKQFGMLLTVTDKKTSENLIRTLVVYLYKISEISDKDFPKLFEKIPEPSKSKIMSTYDMIIQKGIEKGIEKGMEKGMEQGLRTKAIRFILNLHKNGFDIPTIIKMTEEKEDFVKDVINGKIKA